jgi:hypothetical protein
MARDKRDEAPKRLTQDPATVRGADPASLPVSERPRRAPGGTGGRASLKERKDPVDHASDESFPASDPPSSY